MRALCNCEVETWNDGSEGKTRVGTCNRDSGSQWKRTIWSLERAAVNGPPMRTRQRFSIDKPAVDFALVDKILVDLAEFDVSLVDRERALSPNDRSKNTRRDSACGAA
jgi:hypothetical protein